MQDDFFPKKYQVQNNSSVNSGGAIKLKISIKGEKEVPHRFKDKKKKKKKSSKNKDRDRHRSKDRNQESTSCNYKSFLSSPQEKTKHSGPEPSARAEQKNPYQLGFPQRNNVQLKQRGTVEQSNYQTNQQHVNKKSTGHYSQQTRQTPYSRNEVNTQQKQHSSYTNYNQSYQRHTNYKSSPVSNQHSYNEKYTKAHQKSSTESSGFSKPRSSNYSQLMMQASRNEANTKYNRNQIVSDSYISANNKHVSFLFNHYV